MFVPERVVTNEHFANYLDTSDEWIVTRTGIRERRWAAPEESTSTMAAQASARAIQDAGLSADDIDLIICATATGDCQFPATAAFVQAALGTRQVGCFDLSAACAGFVYAAIAATSLIHSGIYRNILVIGAETLSRVVDPQDRTMVVLFGDGAGAAVLSRTDNPEQAVLHCELGCDGTRAEHIWVPAGGSRMPTTDKTVAERLQFMKMRGREVFKFAVAKMAELIDRALQAGGCSADDLKLVIPHQSNLRIIEAARARLGLPPERVAVNIQRYGNTSAASVIMSLDEARRAGTVATGDLVLMLGIGAGLTWSAMLLKL
jgi:3-oxoacyl-[acyl-carrier-protein] synthase-3